MRSPSAFRAGSSILLVGLLLAVAVVGVAPVAAVGETEPNLIVGFKTRSVDGGLLASLGATVLGDDVSLGIAAVYVADVQAFTTAALLRPDIAWVETNDVTRAFASGWDASGWDSSGWDASGWDSSGWDASGWDASGWDANGWDASGWDASGWDASGWDSSGWDASGWDASGWDASGWDASGWDASGWDASGWDASGWDASGWDASAMTTIGRSSSASGTDPLVAWQWGIAAVNASRSAVTGGSSQNICFTDSGVDYTHPDLAANIWSGPNGTHGYDFVNLDSDPMDDAGHGTHVAGIAAASTGNGQGIAGMSAAEIMAVKVLNSTGVGEEYDLAVGIDWCRENGADVISMSLGTPENSKAIHRAIVDAYAAGIVLVASAGNTGSCDCVQWPAAYPQVISVGAATPGGKPAAFSAQSRGVDLSAPGYAIVSTVTANGYAQMQGTSMAVPYVSALFALLLAEGADGATAARIVKNTAQDLGPTGRDQYFGYGVVNYGAALAQV